MRAHAVSTYKKIIFQLTDELYRARDSIGILTISLPLIVCSGMASSRPLVLRISCRLELNVLERTQRGAPSLRLKQPSILTTS